MTVVVFAIMLAALIGTVVWIRQLLEDLMLARRGIDAAVRNGKRRLEACRAAREALTLKAREQADLIERKRKAAELLGRRLGNCQRDAVAKWRELERSIERQVGELVTLRARVRELDQRNRDCAAEQLKREPDRIWFEAEVPQVAYAELRQRIEEVRGKVFGERDHYDEMGG